MPMPAHGHDATPLGLAANTAARRYMLGMAYEVGRGVDAADTDLAARWYRRCHLSGDTRMAQQLEHQARPTRRARRRHPVSASRSV